ncbi:hypothetical protein [Frankia sp. R82]|uniref:hypothetical protein n=1 Tax=Frankia sp. R82 TaxID=2950553 RepID=UPI0020448C62|nr:hypothetical protein [Frankia sp. R82]MCM3886433.1 hypothetical protein [Frankia sp. R82]
MRDVRVLREVRILRDTRISRNARVLRHAWGLSVLGLSVSGLVVGVAIGLTLGR